MNGVASGREVLVVEDDQDVLECVAMVLELEGLGVRAVQDGAGCVALLSRGFSPGVILLDLVLPDGEDGELLRSLRRSRWSGIPLLVMTGMTRPDLPDGVPLLSKPFDVDELVTRVTSLMTPDARSSA